jgi:serine/threonine-protein kinase
MANRPIDPALDVTTARGMAAAVDAHGGTVAADGAPSATAGLRPGLVLAETYEITRLLGQGGMGAVWEAKHLRLPGKRVVVKVLLFGATDPTVLARFRREAEIGSRLGHPNIVQVLDFNTLPGGTPYIVLELLQGESLAARLARGPLPLDEVKAIVTQVGSALAAAHREGVVHRDLKPDNVFLCPTDLGGEVHDVVKVLDFGISKIRGSTTVLTQDAALLGTPQYMAPEQATGHNDQIDARTDVFAFGAMTFEMLAGEPPFSGDTLASVIHAIVYSPTPSLAAQAPDLPPAIVAAVERAMEKNRDARFPDVGSFVKAVTSRSLATPPGLAPAPPRTESAIATERVERKRSSKALWVALGLGVAAVVGFTVLKARPQPSVAPERPTPAEVTRASPPPPPPVATSPSQPVAKPTAPAPAPKPEPTAEAKREDDKPAPRAPSRPTRSGAAAEAPTLPPEAARDLDDAEAALAAGKPAEAIRLAQHSLYAQASSRAYAVITGARCAEGDLGNAKAAFAHLSPRDRPQVTRACGKLGIELR